MYLSRLILNPYSRDIRAVLRRPHQLHHIILKAFPNGIVGTPRTVLDAAGVLFRLDTNLHTHQMSLLVQSQQRPDWKPLNSTQYLHLDTDWFGEFQNPSVKKVDFRFQAGQMFSFRLLANPTKRERTKEVQGKGKRKGLYKEEEQLKWIQDKGRNHGFMIDHVLLSRQKFTEDRKKNLKFFNVQFDGILQVTDPDKFLAGIHNGIGSGKAFGFGLLSVAPAR